MHSEVAGWSDGETGDAEVRLPGGNVGGAVRVGGTVRRQTGPWTPAVHTLLGCLDGRVPGDPAGSRARRAGPGGAELPAGPDYRHRHRGILSAGQIVSLVSWTRSVPPGGDRVQPPRTLAVLSVAEPTLIGHNDIAPYNACFDGDTLAGVFDWDLAGPTTPLLELAFMAWNCVPLWRDDGTEQAAERLKLIASGYGDAESPARIGARQILRAVPNRIQLMLGWIPAAAAAGDAGMARLMSAGEPGRSAAALADLISRIPAIDRALGQ